MVTTSTARMSSLGWIRQTIVRIRRSEIALLRELHPAVEGRSAAIAASTWLDPEVTGRSLDHVAKTNLVVVGNESREANLVRRSLGFGLGGARFAGPSSRPLSHAVLRPLVALANALYADHASSNGGTSDARRRLEVCSSASLICDALADGNTDHNNAVAPVTNGTATLVPPRMSAGPSAPRLAMRSPGAHK